jgi:glycosyltransferase involved in cell wall biosynthesis
MHWTVASPFFTAHYLNTLPWLDDFVPPGRQSFTKIPRRETLATRGWHVRASRNSSLAEWVSYWNQSTEAWQITQGGLITVFPQLATMVGWRKRSSRRQVPVVAWCFNVGALYSGVKGLLARAGLHCVDQFVVHSRRECGSVSRWLKIPESRFQFAPLQRAPIAIVEREETDDPFLLAMGSANRDYGTLFEAVGRIGVRTIVVASPLSLKGLVIPPNVQALSSLSAEECHRLAQRARLSIVPLMDHATAAGQVTIVEAMRMARPVVATRCAGSEDYIDHGRTGMLVSPYSVDDLTNKINELWHEKTLRDSLAGEAGRYAEEHFSDEAAGTRLGNILDQFG